MAEVMQSFAACNKTKVLGQENRDDVLAGVLQSFSWSLLLKRI